MSSIDLIEPKIEIVFNKGAKFTIFCKKNYLHSWYLTGFATCISRLNVCHGSNIDIIINTVKHRGCWTGYTEKLTVIIVFTQKKISNKKSRISYGPGCIQKPWKNWTGANSTKNRLKGVRCPIFVLAEAGAKN